MESALRLFEKKGFTRTSIDSITESADVGKGTFYNYFDSKEALLATWGLQLLNVAAEDLKTPPDDEQPALRTLFQFFSTLLEPIQARPRLAGPFLMATLFAPQAVNDIPAPAETEGEGEGEAPAEPQPPPRICALVQPFVERAMEQGMLRTDLDPAQIVKALVGAFYHSVLLHALGEEALPPRDALRSHLALTLEGLAPGE
jgi:AcrR family transcriptional regulator